MKTLRLVMVSKLSSVHFLNYYAILFWSLT